MTDLRTLPRSGPHPLGPQILPHVKMAVLAALSAAPILVAVSLVPRDAALPVICGTAFALAGIVAVAAWSLGARRDRDTITPWDIAGAFVLVGCVAAVLAEPESILQTFGLTPN
jgi:hypothetical protein